MLLSYEGLKGDIKSILTTALNANIKAFNAFEVLKMTGIRISEIDEIYWTTFDNTNYSLICPKTMTNRYFQEHELPLKFKEYLQSKNNSEILTIKSSLYNYMEAYFFPHFFISNVRSTALHIFRYYYCRYLLYELNYTVLQIKEKMSHKTLAVTNTYLFAPISNEKK
jgi:hypothetical protein